MAKSHQVKSALALFAAGTMLVAGGCSDGSSLDAPPGSVQTFNESGRLVQAPVKNAKVCADLNKNKICDPTEPFTLSDATGNFTLSFEGSATLDYDIVSEGGLYTNGAGAEVSARNMASVAGAKVLSMLTTMEVMTPPAQRAALVAQLNALAGAVDYRTVDFAADAVPVELMLMVKTVESILDGFEVTGAGSLIQQQTVLEELGKAIAVAPELTAANIHASLPALMGTAAEVAMVNILAADPNLEVTSLAAFNSAMEAIATSVAVAIPAGPPVTEAAIQTTVEAAVADSTQGVLAVVASLVKLELAEIILTNNAGPLPWSAAALPTSLTLNSLPSSLEVRGVATNTTGTPQSFANVTVKLTIAQSTRSISLSVGGLTAAVATDGTLSLTKGTSPLQVTGQTASGVLVNASIADTSWGTASGNSISFNLNALNAQLQANGGRDLNTLVASGTYTISAEVTGAPFVAMTKALNLIIQ